MWGKIVNGVLVALLWAAVIAYAVFATILTREHRTRQSISRVEVRITDSTANERLVTSRRVREWIVQSGIPTIGTPMAEVDVSGIRDAISRNSFVERVDIYITYNGVMHIDVDQCCPVMRLMCDGYNSYFTRDGFTFPAPEGSALYIPVVSGSYRPLVPPDFEGYASAYLDTLLRASERRQQDIVKERLRLRDSDRLEVRTINRNRVKRFRRKLPVFEGQTAYEELKRESDEARDAYVEEHRARRREIAARLKLLDEREAEECRQCKIWRQKYDDLQKLANFVCRISSDEFWSGEVVQTVAEYTPAGELELTLIPRSGNFRIEFGSPDEAQPRLERLMHFYRKGLGTAGWDKYRVINVRYNNQVVCTQ